MRHRLQWNILIALLPTLGVGTAETVVLRNSFHLEVDRLESGPDRVRLLLSNGGWIDVPAGEVRRVIPSSGTPVESSASDAIPAIQPSITIADELDRLADQAGLPRALVRAVAWAESGNRQDAVSPKGAIGLMQLMPATAAELGVDPTDPVENIKGGTLYLKQMLDLYEGDREQITKALAAYNAGPGRVDEYGGLPPYPETIAYVTKVVREFLSAEQQQTEPGAEGPGPR